MNPQRKIKHFLLGQITKMKFFLDINEFSANDAHQSLSVTINNKLDIIARIIQYSWLITDNNHDFDFNDSINLYDIFSLNKQVILPQKNIHLNISNTAKILTNKVLFNDIIKYIFLFLYNKDIKDINYSSDKKSINIKTLDIITYPTSNKLIEILMIPDTNILKINYGIMFELSRFLKYTIVIKDNNFSIFF